MRSVSRLPILVVRATVVTAPGRNCTALRTAVSTPSRSGAISSTSPWKGSAPPRKSIHSGVQNPTFQAPESPSLQATIWKLAAGCSAPALTLRSRPKQEKHNMTLPNITRSDKPPRVTIGQLDGTRVKLKMLPSICLFLTVLWPYGTVLWSYGFSASSQVQIN